MRSANALKVGLLTLVALVLAVAAISWLAQFSLQPRGYRLQVVYEDVNGLLPGANVQLMGVRIGRVLAVVPHERSVTVDVQIFSDRTRLLEGSRFEIFSKGIIGEKNLEIFPPPTGEVPIAPGSTVVGENPQRLEFAVERANDAVRALQRLANSPETRRMIAEVLTEARATVGELQRLTVHTDAVVVSADQLIARTSALTAGSAPDIQGTVHNLRLLSGELDALISAVGTGETVQNAQQTLRNARELSERLDRLAGQVEHLTTNPGLQHEVSSVLQGSEGLVQGLSKARQEAPLVRLSPRFSLEGIAGQQAYLAGDLELRLFTRHNELGAGVEEVGQGDYVDLSWGQTDFFGPQTGFHVGLIRSKLGLGLDWRRFSALEEGLGFTGELFDPVEPQVRFGADYAPGWLGHKYGLSAQWIRDIRTGNNTLRLGIQWRPLD